ncbi:MAG: AAA family ATPase, partial [Romboutsia sp.]|nr:AAA family ATPase [Romboutsia sp.]
MNSLYLKYRPKDFNGVIGQESIIKILKQQLDTDNIFNCMIFSGVSGTGKTTVARIFADEVNKHCGYPIEIDAASNNGVDNVKQIVSSAAERSINSEYKVYIIDEAHMLSTQAWNAFLKTIEEPPKYTIFIFCTTDPHKIPETIQNRCMRFNFTRVVPSLIEQKLDFICRSENNI